MLITLRIFCRSLLKNSWIPEVNQRSSPNGAMGILLSPLWYTSNRRDSHSKGILAGFSTTGEVKSPGGERLLDRGRDHTRMTAN